MGFKEYKQLDLVARATECLSFWQENTIFEKTISSRDSKDAYVFYEGPPSANGMPGIHHVMGRAIKDVFCRYQTLKGKQVKRKGGWDTHGLPIELSVEKELGITKEDIGKKISVEEYNKACKDTVMRYTDVWNKLTQDMGYWVDLENPYITYEPKYMESLWWLLKELHSKNLLYKGYTIQPYSPAAGTGLSTHELNQPGTYQDVTDTTIVAQFKAISSTLPENLKQYPNTHILAWTTTPWTLPSNTALTVGAKIDYVVVKTFNQYTFEPVHLILAKDLVGKNFKGKYQLVESIDEVVLSDDKKKIPYCIVDQCSGSDLVGTQYEQLLPLAQPYQDADKAFRVIPGDFVTTADGTGIVHTAPTFGADDMFVAQKADIPPMLILNENDNPVPLVDLQGKFVKELGEWGGQYVKNEYYADGEQPEKSIDVQIAIRLKEENKAFLVEKYKHSYPHCWRTDKPVLYYPLDSWFIKTTAKKDELIALNKTINWKPKSTGEGRFGNWLENLNDWNLSRSRFWGTPLPIWRTEDGTEEKCIGSLEELTAEIQKSIEKGFMEKSPFEGFEPNDFSKENYEKVDLHKHIVDKIVLVSSKGEPMQRESDLIDVWFDSGAMPFAQQHYPFENKEAIDNHGFYPADFIAEGVDQTRGWFFTLHAISTLVFDQVSFKNVVSNGLVLDKKGQKMSKRLGNAIDPFTTLDKYGPDATRWYMLFNAQPWDNLKFDLDGVDEVRKKFFGTLYNTYSFFALYANLDGFTYKEDAIELSKRTELDQWILSELNTLIEQTDKFYAEYEPTKAARAIVSFVNDNLSNWYVRLNRRRFWKSEYSADKQAAYQTLYECLLTVCKLSSPIAPFITDVMYRDLNNITKKETAESIHLALWPEVNKEAINAELEKKTKAAQNITSLVFSLRKKEMIKVRQPLQKILIPALNAEEVSIFESVSEIVKSEVNVKEIQILTAEEAGEILVKEIKPNFKALGPKFGPKMKLIAGKIAQFTQEDIKTIEIQKAIDLEINDEKIQLGIEDVEILSKDIDGLLVASEKGLTVALDIHITPELKEEGIAREMVNKIQTIRKNSLFEVKDKINLVLSNKNDLYSVVQNFEEYIKNETLCENMDWKESLTGEEIELNGINTYIEITKI